MKAEGIMILGRSEIAGLMSFTDYMDAVEQAFALLAAKKIGASGILELPGKDGTFHIKGAGLTVGEEHYIAVKVNGNFPQNKSRFGLPTIQGAILLCDAIRGFPLALLDSIEITIQRTAAATAIAAKRLARSDSRVATICGCGVQGRIQLYSLTRVLPIRKAFAFDQDYSVAEKFAGQASADLGISVTPIRTAAEGTKESDVIVTCTTSRRFFLNRQDVPRGAFVAAVGADSPDKQEIDPELFSCAKVVVDILEQCIRIGDLHHAIQANRMTASDVYSELSEIVSGAKAGRASPEEIIVFDSTGTALQDVAAAVVAYQRAIDQGKGKWADLAG